MRPVLSNQERTATEYRAVSGSSWRVCQRAFERLEPIAGKLARWVLRGRSGGNVTLLPDSKATKTKKLALNLAHRGIAALTTHNS